MQPMSEEHTWDLDMIFGMNEALVLCVLEYVLRLFKVSRGNLDGHNDPVKLFIDFCVCFFSGRTQHCGFTSMKCEAECTWTAPL